MKPLIAIIASLFTLGCGSTLTTLATDHAASDPVALQQVAPESLNFAAAAQYSADRCGLTMLVARQDQILFEDYPNGHRINEAVHLFSGTKAFWSIAIAAMIEDGIIESYDQLAVDVLMEWERPFRHPGKDQIRLRDIMTLSSGLSQNLSFLFGFEPRAFDTYEYAVDNLRLTAPVGTDFSYGPSEYYLAGAIMERQLASSGLDPDPLNYLEERILDPIGLRYARWNRDSAGNPILPNGAFLTARNWAKFGQLLLNNGVWNGQPLVDPALVTQLYQPSPANPGHGLFIWLNQPGGFGPSEEVIGPNQGHIYYNGYSDMVAALGAGKSRMYIIPSEDLVILRQANTRSNTFEDHEFLSLLFGTPPGGRLSRTTRSCPPAV